MTNAHVVSSTRTEKDINKSIAAVIESVKKQVAEQYYALGESWSRLRRFIMKRIIVMLIPWMISTVSVNTVMPFKVREKSMLILTMD